jgi:hypothetical protein
MGGIFSKIISRLHDSKSNSKSEIENLNTKCNKVFEDIYTRCRIDFGRELLELMDIKRRIAEKCEVKENCNPVQEMQAKKIFELILLYFNLADSIVSMKPTGSSDGYVDNTKDKMIKVHELVNTLNNQFYIKADSSSSQDLCEDLINEAEALRNVIEQSITPNSKGKLYE